MRCPSTWIPSATNWKTCYRIDCHPSARTSRSSSSATRSWSWRNSSTTRINKLIHHHVKPNTRGIRLAKQQLQPCNHLIHCNIMQRIHLRNNDIEKFAFDDVPRPNLTLICPSRQIRNAVVVGLRPKSITHQKRQSSIGIHRPHCGRPSGTFYDGGRNALLPDHSCPRCRPRHSTRNTSRHGHPRHSTGNTSRHGHPRHSTRNTSRHGHPRHSTRDCPWRSYSRNGSGNAWHCSGNAGRQPLRNTSRCDSKN